MTRHHLLDPLARQLLRVMGQLPPKPSQRNCQKNLIEKELQQIKLRQKTLYSEKSFCIDINRATASELKQLPGCDEKMIELLLRLQRGGVQLSHQDELFQLLQLPQSLSKEWSSHLVFRWYGDSPPLESNPLLDLNNAAALTLEKTLGWPKERLLRLLRERQKRPFENLADLQERMTLHPSIIEKMIGIVSFGSKPAGPILPPRNS